MPERTLSLILTSSDATAQAAARLAPMLRPGDIVLLEGNVGAGKTHFARAAIQSLLRVPEDVPSPTFTLVQTYQTRLGPVWHADLYRIGAVEEIEELGLLEAFDTAICFLEWPDRLGPLRPQGALTLHLADGGDEDARRLTAQWEDARWDKRLQGWTQS
ncbi:tRNA threonylcarbamoyladenosine biosynthesis protein TsaE [Roseobacter fucihabitans]|uniref:tRNA threonylcarbamoyladenosine biosynthesis protein TsaE n=1 Tax=Roseobacter fucihabitans TaxID=1537242 RepID=A0ABZ2C200_9RHOB|nr:tRNA (adenosine(37)-N6)-threonylcarbamoyltransferase complex ATPase subunit type 1 TsaE [Roseobacter litoralis]MBC6963890.1 tRNA threonylcarbamoyladenosine biosynthesis protein TsaE [Roseobacter litoralis]MBC6964025.1 tRNA threonylcarbamoyladenosine biosynthesis protein TsaE [Roseobacter litoralis]